MSLRDILVVLNGSMHDEPLLTTALELAQRHGAHVTGFCPLEVLSAGNLRYALGGYPELLALQDMASRLEAEALEKSRGVEALFREKLRRYDIPGDWQVPAGEVGPVVARRARAADLVMVSQNDPDHGLPPAASGLIEDMLMMSGRPVLVVPYAGRYETLGANVLVGWNGSREAARALHDALPLIQPAAKVTILTVEPASTSPDKQEAPDADIAAHLARHGLNVSLARTIGGDGISDGDAILGYASDTSADLLVIGAYGHSRTRELIMGGVTRSLLQQMTLPVLMSH